MFPDTALLWPRALTAVFLGQIGAAVTDRGYNEQPEERA